MTVRIVHTGNTLNLEAQCLLDLSRHAVCPPHTPTVDYINLATTNMSLKCQTKDAKTSVQNEYNAFCSTHTNTNCGVGGGDS